jgi:biopolymer transport protein TolQ
LKSDLSFIYLIADASLTVQLVLLVLLLASLLSWALIFRKWRVLMTARRAAEIFEDRFWSGGDVTALFKNLHARRENLSGLERIFEAGFSEFARLHKQAGSPERILEVAQRSMRIALSRETNAVESHLSFLATVGSTSPYVGLFGTVWGIMNSFRALSNVQQATLAMVAPGIAEALVATAMGLFAAIPAVIAYNRFSSDVERLLSVYDNFMEEFATLLHRQVYERDARQTASG